MPFIPEVENEIPTLGYGVVDWMLDNLAMPDRIDFEPITFYREMVEFILDWYALDPVTGRRCYTRGVLSRSRGWAKSPVVAALAAAEAIGAPVVPMGWDANGRPVGAPWHEVRRPDVQIAAVSESQTGNTWGPLIESLREEAPVHRNYPGILPMQTFVDLPGGFGKILRLTASPKTIKGKTPVFQVLDQALALDTPIPTPDGWRSMGDLETGDFVYGSHGPVRITEAKPVSRQHNCYRVTFDDGTSVVASEGHLWQTRRSGYPQTDRDAIRRTGQMLDGKRYRVPVAPARPMPEADLPVHPYLLGYWLGNGTRNKCELSVGVEDVDAIEKNLAEIGIQTWRRRYGEDAAYNLTFTRALGFQNANRPEPAKALSALPCYIKKNIPDEYLCGSIEQRTQLIRGLMDSDGCVTEAGTCTFVNTNKQIIDAFVAILRSLGQVARPKFIEDDRYTLGGKYRVDFTPRGGFMPVALPRKASRVHQHRRSPEWIGIASIETVEPVPVRCIAVDSDDHLFACGTGGHLTHNTEAWVASNKGLELAAVMRANAAKVGGTTLESPNAFVPGEDSVAQKSAEFWEMIQEGTAVDETLYYNHREAPATTDVESASSLMEGLRVAYGDSSAHKGGCVIHVPPCSPGHVDLERIISTIFDPAQPIQNSRSDFLNQITHHSDAWMSAPDWNACYRGDRIIHDGDAITLGFDGSKGRARGKADATALIGCRVKDGHMFEVKVWEQPNGAEGKHWTPPVMEVDAAVRRCFELYNVVGFYADPNAWTEYIVKWEAAFARRLKVKAAGSNPMMIWPSGKKPEVTHNVERLRVAIVESAAGWRAQAIDPESATPEFSHDGSFYLTKHVLNARQRNNPSGYLLYKAYPESWDKIDAAYAAVMAWRARLDAVSRRVGDAPKVGQVVTL